MKKREQFILLVGIVAMLLLVPTILSIIYSGSYGYWYPHHMTWPWVSGFGWAGMGGWLIALLILVVVVVWVLNTEERGNEARGGGTSAAREILDERYARGEISEEEYLKMRARLER